MRAVLPVLIAVLLMPTVSFADAPDLKELAEHPRWKALLHVNQGATTRGRGHSYVEDEAFFLHPRGKYRPEQELRASIKALRPPDSPERCRFPARYRFLAESLGWDSEREPLAHCDEYQQWREMIPGSRVVMVFPAAYLNSPSSMFGHTLLRIDSDDDDGSEWLSWAINFAAQVRPDDNSLFYIYRGLAGGYPGQFSIVPYAQKIQEYGHLENRDIWEYRLNLEPEETRWLLEHLWELQDINFDYYFFDENCSFRLLELLEVARPGNDFLKGWRFAEIPVNTVRALYDADMVAGWRYRPSKAVELRHRLEQLDVPEQKLARRLADDPALAETAEYRALEPETLHLAASVAYQYLRHHHRRHDIDADMRQRNLALLHIVNENPAPELPEIKSPVPPEQGHGTKMVAATGGAREDTGFGEAQFRWTFHDWLDRDAGFFRGAGIEGLNLRIRQYERHRPRLEQLDVVRIRSLAPRDRFLKPVSWFVHGGLERRQAGERRRLVRQLQGGPGLAWRLGNAKPHVFAVARMENNSAWEPLVRAGGGVRAGVLYYAGGFQWGAGTGGVYFSNDEYRHQSDLTLNVPLARNHALRAKVLHQGWRDDDGGETEFRLSWRYFFD